MNPTGKSIHGDAPRLPSRPRRASTPLDSWTKLPGLREGAASASKKNCRAESEEGAVKNFLQDFV